MSRVLGSKHKYGILAAGAVSGSLIGRLPSRRRELGPICAVSYRVASRIANTVRAGYPVRSADELDAVPAILIYSPPEYLDSLLELLEKAAIHWAGKALVFCDSPVEAEVRGRFAAKGASVAVAREFGVPPRIIVEGDDGAAVGVVQHLARDLGLKAVAIAPGSGDLFAAAVTLGTAAITPLIDRTTALLRDAGIRDIEAAKIASSLFEQTARDFAHSGKQSWTWYARKPEAERLEAQIANAGKDLAPMLRQLMLFGFETFQKHREVGAELSGEGKASG